MEDDERRILEFEEQHPGVGMAKASAISTELGMKPVRYEQRLGQLLRRRDVIEAFPMVANRHMRLSERRAGLRAARTL